MTLNHIQDYRDACAAFDAAHDFSLNDHLEAFLLVGSHAYGTDTEESDADYVAIVTPPAKYLIGLSEFDGWQPGPDNDGLDFKVFSWHKFLHLALQGNPNIVEMLFLGADCNLIRSDNFCILQGEYGRFLSKHVVKRFLGYASGQMKKMESGKATGHLGHKRKEEVARLGLDPKDASHCIRLLYTAHLLAISGSVVPRLPDWMRRHVRDIKEGKWTPDQVKSLAYDLIQDCEEALVTTTLPEEPDYEWVEQEAITVASQRICGPR